MGKSTPSLVFDLGVDSGKSGSTILFGVARLHCIRKNLCWVKQEGAWRLPWVRNPKPLVYTLPSVQVQKSVVRPTEPAVRFQNPLPKKTQDFDLQKYTHSLSIIL